METAMSSCQDKYQFKVTWEPFFLRSNMPMEGVEKPSNYGPDSPSSQRLINAGKSVGIDFSYKSKRFPNTLLGHCALEYALFEDPSGEKQNVLQETLFKSYFTDGEYPDAGRVSSLASSVGLKEETVKAYVNDSGNQDRVKTKASRWSSQGISGVPSFFINGQMTFSGAQDPRNFVHIFDKIAEKVPPAKA